jgi:hypothetical protein
VSTENTFVLECKADHEWENFASFDFIPMTIPIEHTVCTCLKIFNDLGIVKKFKININNLVMYIQFRHYFDNY